MTTLFDVGRSMLNVGRSLFFVLCALCASTPLFALDITTGPAAGITRTNAAIAFDVVSTNGGTNVVSAVLYYGQDDHSTNASLWATALTSTVFATGLQTNLIVGLTPAQTYYYRHRMIAGTNYVWSLTTSNFTTLAGAPTNQPAQVAHTVMVDSNGVIVAPTNFAAANNLVVDGGSAYLTNGSPLSALSNDVGYITSAPDYLPQIRSLQSRAGANAISDAELALQMTALATWATAPFSQYLADYFTDQAWYDSGISTGVTFDVSTGYFLPVAGSLVLAYYKLDDVSGTSVEDSSGNGHTGTIAVDASTLTTADAMVGTAFKFTGLGSQIETGVTNFVGNNSFTVMWWQKDVLVWEMPVFWGNDGIALGCVSIWVHPSTYLIWNTQSGPLYSTTVFDGNTNWLHVALTYDGTMQRMYVNGLQEAECLNGANIIPDGSQVILSPAIQPVTVGIIDEVQMYKTALSSNEIYAAFSLTPPTTNVAVVTDGIVQSLPWSSVSSNNFVSTLALLDSSTNTADLTYSQSVDGGSTWSNVSLSCAGTWGANTNYYRWTGSQQFDSYGTSILYRVNWSNSCPAKLKGVVNYVEDVVR